MAMERIEEMERKLRPFKTSYTIMLKTGERFVEPAQNVRFLEDVVHVVCRKETVKRDAIVTYIIPLSNIRWIRKIEYRDLQSER